MKKLFPIIFLSLAGLGCGVAAVVFIIPFFMEGGYEKLDPTISFPFWIWWLIGIIFGWTSYGLLKLAWSIFKDK
jgi:hypothetical protein